MVYTDRSKPNDHELIGELPRAHSQVLAFWTIVNTNEVLSLDVHPNLWAIATKIQDIWAGTASPGDLMKSNNGISLESSARTELDQLEKSLSYYQQKYPNAMIEKVPCHYPTLCCADCTYICKQGNSVDPFSGLGIHLESEDHEMNEQLSPSRSFELLQLYAWRTNSGAKIVNRRNAHGTRLDMVGCHDCDEFEVSLPLTKKEVSLAFRRCVEHFMVSTHKRRLQARLGNSQGEPSRIKLAERAVHILGCLRGWFADARLEVETVDRETRDPVRPYVIECLHCRGFTYKLSLFSGSSEVKAAFEQHLHSAKHSRGIIQLSTRVAEQNVSPVQGQTSSTATVLNKTCSDLQFQERYNALRSKHPGAEFDLKRYSISNGEMMRGTCECDGKTYSGRIESVFRHFEQHLAKQHSSQQEEITDSDVEDLMNLTKPRFNTRFELEDTDSDAEPRMNLTKAKFRPMGFQHEDMNSDDEPPMNLTKAKFKAPTIEKEDKDSGDERPIIFAKRPISSTRPVSNASQVVSSTTRPTPIIGETVAACFAKFSKYYPNDRMDFKVVEHTEEGRVQQMEVVCLDCSHYRCQGSPSNTLKDAKKHILQSIHVKNRDSRLLEEIEANNAAHVAAARSYKAEIEAFRDKHPNDNFEIRDRNQHNQKYPTTCIDCNRYKETEIKPFTELEAHFKTTNHIYYRDSETPSLQKEFKKIKALGKYKPKRIEDLLKSSLVALIRWYPDEYFTITNCILYSPSGPQITAKCLNCKDSLAHSGSIRVTLTNLQTHFATPRHTKNRRVNETTDSTRQDEDIKIQYSSIPIKQQLVSLPVGDPNRAWIESKATSKPVATRNPLTETEDNALNSVSLLSGRSKSNIETEALNTPASLNIIFPPQLQNTQSTTSSTKPSPPASYSKYLALLTRQFPKDNFTFEEIRLSSKLTRFMGLCPDCDYKSIKVTAIILYQDLKAHLSSASHFGKWFAKDLTEKKNGLSGASTTAENSKPNRNDFYKTPLEAQNEKKRKQNWEESPYSLSGKRRRVDVGSSGFYKN